MTPDGEFWGEQQEGRMLRILLRVSLAGLGVGILTLATGLTTGSGLVIFGGAVLTAFAFGAWLQAVVVILLDQ